MIPLADFSLDRMVRAVEKVRERLLRSTGALEKAGVPYAVIGGNAVAAWVARVDESAVRNTADVDLLLCREDLERAKQALGEVGFIYRHVASIELFLNGPNAKTRDAVRVIFAGEKVRKEYLLPAPAVEESEKAEQYRVLTLEALVRMKLTSFRDKDRTHLRDFLDVGLIDGSWSDKVANELGKRLQMLIENPLG